MRSLLLSRPDLDFLLHDWLRIGQLADRDTVDALLDVSEQVATEHFAPHNRTADLDEPRFDGERVHLIPEVGKALEVFARTGVVGAAMPEEAGGMGLPHAVAQACMLWFQAANIRDVGVSVPHDRQREPADRARRPRAGRDVPAPDARGAVLRHDVPVGAAGGLVARRHHDARGAAGRRYVPALRQQDVDLRR